MKATWNLLACLVLLVPLARLGAEPDLVLKKEILGRVEPGVPVSYFITVPAQDWAAVSIDLNHASALARVFDGAGVMLRGTRIEDAGQISFLAPANGRYRIELHPERAGTYSIMWAEDLSVDARRTPAVNPFPADSPRIQALQAAVRAGTPNAVPAFWDKMKTQGVPFIEPLEGDSKSMLVTFLWKGTASTRRVLLFWPGLIDTNPGKCRLARVGDTDIWFTTIRLKKTRRVRYRLVENGPNLAQDKDPAADQTWQMLAAMSQKDPLNPKWIEPKDNYPDLDRFHGMSLLEMPDAPAEPWLRHHAGIPAGTISVHTVRSARLGTERTVKVYTPPGYRPNGKPYPVIYEMDGDSFIKDMRVPEVLDNLLAAHRIPPMVAVFVYSAPGERFRELQGNAAYTDFLAAELAPWVRRSYHVSADPRQVLIGGIGYGAMTAACTAVRHSDVFGNVLAESGSFDWMPLRSKASLDASDFPPEPVWMSRQFLESPRLPIRFFLSSGLDEVDISGYGESTLVSSRHLRDILRAKGYDVSYKEIEGSHDTLNWREAFPVGLLLLTRDIDSEVGAD